MKKSIILFAGLIFAFTTVAGTGCGRLWYKHYDAEWVVKKIDKRINALNLNLTDEQKGKLDAIKGKITEHINSRKDSRENMLNLFKKETEKDTPELDSLVKSFKEIHAKRSQDLNEIIDMSYELYLSLDNTQKKKVVEALKNKVDKCERWVR